MKSLTFTTIISLIFFISGCTSLQNQTKADWPEELPPIEYYIDFYQQDPMNKTYISLDQYLLWIKRLYLGWELYRRGWLELSNNLAETIEDEAHRDIAKAKLELIGKTVSPEWAKHRKFSKIKTRHLIIWGNALYQSSANNEQLVIIDKVLSDAKLLIDRQLIASQIVVNRYYIEENLVGIDYPFK
jgi:hypothetical protein